MNTCEMSAAPASDVEFVSKKRTWINLTAYHRAEINATTASQCVLLISLHVLSAVVSSTTQTQTRVTLMVFSASATQYIKT